MHTVQHHAQVHARRWPLAHLIWYERHTIVDDISSHVWGARATPIKAKRQLIGRPVWHSMGLEPHKWASNVKSCATVDSPAMDRAKEVELGEQGLAAQNILASVPWAFCGLPSPDKI